MHKQEAKKVTKLVRIYSSISYPCKCKVLLSHNIKTLHGGFLVGFFFALPHDTSAFASPWGTKQIDLARKACIKTQAKDSWLSKP